MAIPETTAVAGNTAVTVPEFAALVTDVAPATVKKSAATPCTVKPDFAVRLMVAVYVVFSAKVAGLPFQLTVPVYSAVSVMAVTGVPPAAGTVTPCIALYGDDGRLRSTVVAGRHPKPDYRDNGDKAYQFNHVFHTKLLECLTCFMRVQHKIY